MTDEYERPPWAVTLDNRPGYSVDDLWLSGERVMNDLRKKANEKFQLMLDSNIKMVNISGLQVWSW